MWTTHSEQLANGRGFRFAIHVDSVPISFAEVLCRWQTDDSFRSFFNSLLADAPFSAFRWETPPITLATANRPFEFVLLDSPGLTGQHDLTPFAEHFTPAVMTAGVVEFTNLGNDAILIVPCPLGPQSGYGHLAAFVRHSPESLRQTLWQFVGKSMQARLNDRPVWLSTAGAGVSWLHVRLDDRPKYYGFEPYRHVSGHLHGPIGQLPTIGDTI